MLNGLCVPVSTPNNYFELSAAQWLENHAILAQAGKDIEAGNIEREQARNEYEAET